MAEAPNDGLNVEVSIIVFDSSHEKCTVSPI